MRTLEQQKKFEDLLEVVRAEEDLEGQITKNYISHKQYLLLTQFEEVAGVKKDEGIGNYFSSTDFDGIFREYYSNFYHNIMMLMYFEYIENYGLCNVINETINLSRRVLFDTLKTITNKDELIDTVTIVELSEEELKKIIENNYGTNY